MAQCASSAEWLYTYMTKRSHPESKEDQSVVPPPPVIFFWELFGDSSLGVLWIQSRHICACLAHQLFPQGNPHGRSWFSLFTAGDPRNIHLLSNKVYKGFTFAHNADE